MMVLQEAVLEARCSAVKYVGDCFIHTVPGLSAITNREELL